MTIRNLTPTPYTTKNKGDYAEWSVLYTYGIERQAHDSASYDVGSDMCVGNTYASIKSDRFTLMSGGLCEGRDTFDGIWELYESKVHSNTFIYVTADLTAYIMNIEEFKRFVYAFCYAEKESQKNGGALKIRCKHESKKMIAWLQAQAA